MQGDKSFHRHTQSDSAPACARSQAPGPGRPTSLAGVQGNGRGRRGPL